MHYYEVAPNQIVRADSSSFTYSYNEKLDIGQIVQIEVGKKLMNGIVIGEVKKPTYDTKNINKVIIDKPLPKQLVDLTLWISSYYSTPLATVIQSILPRGIDKKRKEITKKQEITHRNRTSILFTDEQIAAISTLSGGKNGTFLLQGVTGSGKTEIYIELAKRTLLSGRSVIVLVPEIALTSQLIAEFSNHFDDVLLTHSKMTESARHQIWLKAINSEKPIIVIGPRSALFTPLRDIGLIVIDEAHEQSLKQEQSPKYSALRAATILGKNHESVVIFGTATPSITDRYLADKSGRSVIRLNNTAIKNSIPPVIELVDMTNRSNFNNHRFLSDSLIDSIKEIIAKKQQVLIFHNRRGSTSSSLCKDCGWILNCQKCQLPMTLHADKHQVTCHICGTNANIPMSCPSCGSTEIIHKGIGTKLIESELKKLFPKLNIARFDADNTTDNALHSKYSELYNGDIDILIGTQIVAKGLDLPNLAMVGVIQADTGLSIPDFNSSERTFQLLAQVIGRVGRNENQTKVIVQSYKPSHPSIIHGLKQDYDSFYKETLLDREKNLFPPFTHLLKLTCVYKTEISAIKNTKKLAGELRKVLNPNVKILGPSPAFYEYQHGSYRWQLILKSPKREYLIEAIKHLPATNWQYDLDPSSLL
jgi:primosomal protein N' (replication factor Y)